MKGSFFHDTVLLKDSKGNYYTSNGLGSSVLKTYLEELDELTVVCREEKMNAHTTKTSLTKSNTPHVAFECIDRLSIKGLFFGNDRAKIRRAVENSDISIIRMPSIIGIVACLEAKRQDKPYVVEVVACTWDNLWNYGKLLYKVAAPILYLVNRMLIRRAPSVIYVSTRFLQNRYATLGQSLACSDVQIPQLKAQDLAERLKKIHTHGPAAPYIIGTVANVDMQFKGQMYVIKAIAKLNRDGLNVEYHLAGAGDSSRLKAVAEKFKVSDKVRFIGPLNHGAVFSFMKSLDIYVQPSLAESHGRVIVEAFSVACPVIGSNAGGIPELVDSKFVFSKKNSADIAKKITEIANSKSLEEQARINFQKASMFEKKYLTQIRSSFLSKCVSGAGDE